MSLSGKDRAVSVVKLWKGIIVIKFAIATGSDKEWKKKPSAETTGASLW